MAASLTEKKKFLFVSLDGLITDIVWQVKKEGHQALLYIDNKAESEIGDGFVEKVATYEDHLQSADVIVFDDVLGQGKLAGQLRAQGKAVIGGTEYTDRLEDDRTFGQEELKKFGIPIIPYQEFTSFDDAISFVQSNPAKYAIKPSGEAQNVKRLLFVGDEEDGRDVIQMLEAYKKLWSDKIKVFQLQKRVTGVEVAVGGFFNGKEFMMPININFENKKLFPGNLGPSTGEMGTFMFWSEPNRMFNLTLKKMEDQLRQEGYVGYIDLNTIVNGNGIYPLEFTAIFGYPTISIQQEGLVTPISDLLYGMATGTMSRFKAKKGFQVGVRVVVPPYPFDDHRIFETYSKDSIISFKRPSREGIHIEDLKEVNGQWMITGSSGVTLVACGTGSTLKQAQSQAYNRISNLIIPNCYYRTDIGDRWAEDSDRLHNWGYLREV